MSKLIQKIKENKILVMLMAIIFIGGYLRFYDLAATSFVADEFLDVNSSYAYSQTGKWQSWDFNKQTVNEENVFSPRDERAWLYKIQVAQMFEWFAPTEATARSVSAIWGLITIVLMYWAAVQFTGKKSIGLIAAFLFAVSIMGIEFDRKLRMYAMFYPLFLLFSVFFFKFFEGIYAGKNSLFKKLSERFSVNGIFLIPALVVGYLSLQVHQLTANFAFIVLAYCLVLAILTAKKEKKYFNKYSLTLAVAAVGFASGMLFFKKAMSGYSAGLIFFDDHFAYIPEILSDYSNYILATLLAGFGGYSIYKTLGKKLEALWISISFLTILLAAIFLWRRNVGVQYIFFGQSFLVLLIASGIYGVARWMQENVRMEGKRNYFVAMVALLILLVPNYAYFFQQDTTYNQTSKAENPNYRKILGYIKKNSNPSDAVVTRNFRSYYLSGAKLAVYDFGGERVKDKITVQMLEEVMSKHARGWVMYSNNDESYVTKEARVFMEDKMEKINAIDVRGNVSVYRWGF